MRTVWTIGSLLFIVACDRTPPPAPSAPPAAPSAPPAAPSAPPAAPSVAVATPPAAGASATMDAAAPRLETELEAVIGDWHPETVGDTAGYAVDGTKWQNGTPSVSLADQAKRLYGARYAEFLDGVKAFAFFPLAIARTPPPSGDLRLSVRFHPLAGKVDQAAGIAFGIADDGSYWGVRANALEDNVLFFHVVKGKRSVLETVRSVPTPSRTWHTLALEIRGNKLEATVDGERRLTRTLEAPVKGRVGLWSKADSHVVFADFTVSSL